VKQSLVGVGAVLALLVAGVAQAALPASVEGSFTTLETDFETIFGFGFAVLTTVVISMLAWRYTRKLGSKI